VGSVAYLASDLTAKVQFKCNRGLELVEGELVIESEALLGRGDEGGGGMDISFS
jgi:hypothetical protein